MKKIIITVFFTLLLAFLALTALFPFVYMLLTSLKQSYSLGLDFSLVGLSFKNYNTVFKNFEFAKYFTNSVIVAVLACVFNCFISSLAAYGFAKKNFVGRDAIFWIYLATLMIPSQVILVPMTVIIRTLHIANTYSALFLPLVNAFGVFLIKQFLENLPNDLLEAARIDGCGELNIYLQIIVPLIKPALVLYRPPKVRPKILTIGGRYFYG